MLIIPLHLFTVKFVLCTFLYVCTVLVQYLNYTFDLVQHENNTKQAVTQEDQLVNVICNIYESM